MSHIDAVPDSSGSHRRWAVALSLFAALGVFMLTALAEDAGAKKKKTQDRARVMSYNLYLGSNLNPSVAAATSNPGDLSQFDTFANEVGFILKNVQANNFPLRARQIANDIRKRNTDLVGLQEAALFRLQIPTDGGAPSATNPGAKLAQTPEVDYLDELLGQLNRKARNGKQCKKLAAKRKANGKKAKFCYQGYRLVHAQDEADIEFPADLDNNPGPDGKGGRGPGSPPGCASLGTTNNFDGNDDTGVSLGDPPLPASLGFGPGANSDFNGDAQPPEAFPGLAACFGDEDPPGTSDCVAGEPPVDSNPGVPAGGPSTDGATCLFHGIDADARLTLRDAILARKGAKVKTSNVLAANYKNKFSIPVFGGASTVNFTRGWLSTDASVRGMKFRFLNTHLESESGGTVREDQAAELVTPSGVGSVKPTVLVGDLNSDPRGGGDSPLAIQNLYQGGFFGLSGGGITFGHGELLSDLSNVLDNSRIDHIMANDPRIAIKGRQVVDTYANSLWNSDHGGLFAALKIKKK
ncbi:hypothetical protein BH20ACT15_BH20ACT15_06750 [soil metagenome]